MPIKVAHLQETGIGKTINYLRKNDGDIGNASRALIFKWKGMVREEEKREKEQQENEEENEETSEQETEQDENQHYHESKLYFIL